MVYYSNINLSEKDSQHDVSSDSLSHAAKGEKVRGHKYLTREFKNGRWMYTYDVPKNNKVGSANNTKTSRNKSEEHMRGNYYYKYDETTGKISKNKEGHKRIKDLKKESKQTRKELEKVTNNDKLHNPTPVYKSKTVKTDNGVKRVQEAYYITDDGKKLNATEYGRYVRAKESEARKKDAMTYANYRRQQKLADQEKAEFKAYKEAVKNSSKKVYSGIKANKGFAIIKKLFGIG